MSRLNINIGTSANDRTGDPLRTAFDKVNQNFVELYATTGADLQLPSQTTHEGKFLRTDGTELSWVAISSQVNADWDATSGVAEILNKPSIPADVSELTDTTNLLSGLPSGTRIVSAPATSQGASGDTAGDIAFDTTAVYYCRQTYSFVPPTFVTVVAVDSNTIWIDDADYADLDTTFSSITGTWRVRNGEIDYTIVSVTADVLYEGSYALVLGSIPDPTFNPFSDYSLYQPAGVDIWLKTNWTSTGSW